MRDRVVVLGSNSFSGSHFVNAVIKDGLTTIGISRSVETDEIFLPYKWNQDSNKNFSFFQLDLNHDLDQIMEIIYDFKPQYIVNFAAQGMVAESWDMPDQWLLTNTLSAVKFHHQLKNCKFLKKFIQISTPEVYGSCDGNIKENTTYKPSTPYAVSKAAVDMSLMTFYNQYDFPVVFTRAANIYGPGQQLYRIIPKTILSFLSGKMLELHGAGKSIRSFIHIDDMVRGTQKAMYNGKPGNIYHLSSTESLSIRSLIKTIAENMNLSFKDHVVDVNDRPGKDQAYLLDSSRAKIELNWQAEVSLDSGINNTIVWVKNNFSVLKNMTLNYRHKP